MKEKLFNFFLNSKIGIIITIIIALFVLYLMANFHPFYMIRYKIDKLSDDYEEILAVDYIYDRDKGEYYYADIKNAETDNYYISDKEEVFLEPIIISNNIDKSKENYVIKTDLFDSMSDVEIFLNDKNITSSRIIYYMDTSSLFGEPYVVRNLSVALAKEDLILNAKNKITYSTENGLYNFYFFVK